MVCGVVVLFVVLRGDVMVALPHYTLSYTMVWLRLVGSLKL